MTTYWYISTYALLRCREGNSSLRLAAGLVIRAAPAFGWDDSGPGSGISTCFVYGPAPAPAPADSSGCYVSFLENPGLLCFGIIDDTNVNGSQWDFCCSAAALYVVPSRSKPAFSASEIIRQDPHSLSPRKGILQYYLIGQSIGSLRIRTLLTRL